MNTKQVIIIRRDLKMRRGKECSQSSHGSMAFLTKRLYDSAITWKSWFKFLFGYRPTLLDLITYRESERTWLFDSFAKVCCRVDSEEELRQIYFKALDKGIEVHMVIDSGRTEFGGKRTATCVVVGPDEVEKVDEITGHLELY